MKILIVKTSSLGDIIHGFSALRLLREHLPNAHIDWVVEQPFAELVEAHPDVRCVLKVHTKKWRKTLFNRSTWQEMSAFRQHLQAETYDVVFDLQGNTKSGFITKMAKAKDKVGFSLKNSFEWPSRLFVNHAYNIPKGTNVREETQSLIKQYFELNDSQVCTESISLQMKMDQQILLNNVLSQLESFPKPYIMVCPGSAWPNKQMKEEALIVFLNLLQEKSRCTFLFISGSQAERQQTEKLQNAMKGASLVIEKLPLPVLQNVMDKMDLVIAMDSLPLHLAGTTQAATFSVFGASLAAKYQPVGSKHSSFQGVCPYGQTFDRRCPKLRSCKKGACIRELSGEELFAHFLDNNPLFDFMK
jgi:heptosyltransferase I